jgi:hypothetical protein
VSDDKWEQWGRRYYGDGLDEWELERRRRVAEKAREYAALPHEDFVRLYTDMSKAKLLAVRHLFQGTVFVEDPRGVFEGGDHVRSEEAGVEGHVAWFQLGSTQWPHGDRLWLVVETSPKRHTMAWHESFVPVPSPSRKADET